MHNVLSNRRQDSGAQLGRCDAPHALFDGPAPQLLHGAAGLRSKPNWGTEMGSGIQNLRRIEARDLNGLPCALLVGRTEDGLLVVGAACPNGDAPMAVLSPDQADQLIHMARIVLRGDEL